LNPGCDCSLDYFDFADLVVVAEFSSREFMSPSYDHPSYSYLRDVPPHLGMKSALPRFTPIKPAHKVGVVLYGVGANQSEGARTDEMGRLVRDLVCTKRIGALFLTNLELEKENVYGSWSCFWREFVQAVASISLPN
jgi:hypothetical protein